MALQETFHVALSALDEERFGVRTARGFAKSVADIEEIARFCAENRAEFVIIRCPCARVEVVHELEKAGGRIMDTLIYYVRDLKRDFVQIDTGRVHVRRKAATDRDQVMEIAAESFAGYHGHYHADPRLDRRSCDAAYVSWAERSLMSPLGAGEVLVAGEGKTCLGFLTLRRNSPAEVEGELFAVAPAAQGRGVGRALMVRGMEWARGEGAETMTISTQVTNLASQKVWIRVGFEPARSFYTLHQWLTE